MGITIDANGDCGNLRRCRAMMAAMMTVANPGDKVIVALRFMKITERTLFSQVQSRFMFRFIHLNLTLMRMSLKMRLNNTQKKH